MSLLEKNTKSKLIRVRDPGQEMSTRANIILNKVNGTWQINAADSARSFKPDDRGLVSPVARSIRNRRGFILQALTLATGSHIIELREIPLSAEMILRHQNAVSGYVEHCSSIFSLRRHPGCDARNDKHVSLESGR